MRLRLSVFPDEKRRRTNVRRAGAILVAGIMNASIGAAALDMAAPDRAKETNMRETPRGAARKQARLAEVPTAEGQDARPPPSDSDIGRDCAALVRATKVVPAKGARPDCPACPATSREALTFHEMKTDAASCSGDTCNVMVTIRASFNPGPGGTLAGGLTAWIPVEQRSAYLSGRAPLDEQVYGVQITYKDRGGAWRAVKFDRGPAK